MEKKRSIEGSVKLWHLLATTIVITANTIYTTGKLSGQHDFQVQANTQKIIELQLELDKNTDRDESRYQEERAVWNNINDKVTDIWKTQSNRRNRN